MSAAVRDNPEHNRFEMDTPAGLAIARYRREGRTLMILHTEVPRAVEGRGLGSQLVQGIFELVRERNENVVPLCGFVRRFVAQHPAYQSREILSAACIPAMRNRTITVSDKMQRGYRYALIALAGRNFDPDFKPQLTPSQMLALGVFGGHYITDCRKEFPASWFARAKLSPGRRDPALNFFGVDASQPLSVWREKGWIHRDDPRGWFQWYCRYYMGRRMEDDARQIGRWKAIRRHVRQIEKNCEPGDLFCRPRQRQALLHWAYDSRKF